MGIKKKADGTFTVQYSKRHPLSRIPVTRIRKGLKSKSEANRVFADLVIQVDDLLKRQVTPTWTVLLDKYLGKLDQENSITKGTIYKRDKVLKRHTLPMWEKKLIDEITGQDIRCLLEERLGDSSESHKKFFLKGITSNFQSLRSKFIMIRIPYRHI